MELDQAMIVAGIGCRKGASAADIQAVIAAALDRAGLAATALGAIATSVAKAGEAGIAAAAEARGVPLRVVDERALLMAAANGVTRSTRVLALTGVPSVAEAAALAAAGTTVATGAPARTANASSGGPRLVLPRIALGPATCALAETGDAP
jgi:cobalt-precorrin 5A hydrolase